MSKTIIINWFILLILSIIWGSSFILMKKGLNGFTYLEIACFRLIIAFVVLIPFLISSFKKFKLKYLKPLLIVSLVGTVIPAILFPFGQTYLNSSSAGMLNSLTPIFTLIIGVILFKKKYIKENIIGIIIGLIGSYILLLPKSIEIAQIKYSLIIILATICYALSINTIKDRLKELKPLDIAVLSSFFSCIIPIIFFLNSNIVSTIEKIYFNIESFYYLLALGIVCTSFAIILFNYLIKKSSALFAASTTYLIPIFAIFWGILDAEIIQNHEIIGLSIILIGVYIMNYKQLE